MQTLFLPSKPTKFKYTDKIDKWFYPSIIAFTTVTSALILLVVCGDLGLISTVMAYGIGTSVPFITFLILHLINVRHQNKKNSGLRQRVKKWELQCQELKHKHKIKCAEEFILEVRHAKA
jgi:hypothetical protein